MFVGAFLLFQVQPLIAKYILPWFGGTPAVWSTCLLFFQAMLLAGYGYAHLVTRTLNVRRQAALHLGLLAASLLLLPIMPSSAWKPVGNEEPTGRILLLLAATIGAPYFLLSATAPLVQSWFGQAYPGRSPYRLYALSNAGSLLALLSYPFVFETLLRLPTQSWLWSAAYAGFLLVCGGCAWKLTRGTAATATVTTDMAANEAPQAADDGGMHGAFAEGESRAEEQRPGGLDLALWIGLSALGTIMLMATTNRLCQDVAAVPFLWILPLSLYLVTFVICFDHPRWYRRSVFSFGVIVAIGLAAAVTVREEAFSLPVQLAIYSFMLFTCCMACHGELVQARPGLRRLTLFYLMISVGGVLGGSFVALVAPLLFDAYYEFGLGLAGCCVALLIVHRRDAMKGLDPAVRRRAWRRIGALGAAAVVVMGVGVGALGTLAQGEHDAQVAARRNFYGVLRVERNEVGSPELERLKMVHGRTVHGVQFQSPKKRRTPTAYYGRESGVGAALLALAEGRGEQGLHVGVVGLGVGTLAAYAEQGDRWVYYEIDPKVETIAENHFTFLADARRRGATCEVRLGDARIVLEREAEAGSAPPYDLLVVDAFSSDAIPMHLLTDECFQVYWRRLRPDGVLAIHVSNRYLDLSPVVRMHAERAGKEACFAPHQPTAEEATQEAALASHWILLSSNRALLARAPVAGVHRPWPQDSRPPLLWTDDFSNLFQVLQ